MDAITQVSSAAVIVYALEWLKRTPALSWITVDTSVLNRVVAALAAAGVALGITISGDSASGWTIAIPSLTGLLAGLWVWVQQVLLQQIIYDGAARRTP